jgi:hypothetical protein
VTDGPVFEVPCSGGTFIMTKLSVASLGCYARIRRMACVAALGLALSGSAAWAQDIPPTVILGHEGLTWDQPVESALELAGYEFRVRIDGELEETVEEVRCASEAQAPGFECSARLPALAPGLHTIELAARRPGLQQGPWSAPLRVSRSAEDSASVPSQRNVMTVDGARLESVPFAGPLDITSLAPLPDGRVLVGDRSGRILAVDAEWADLRVMARGETPELLAIAVHRDFAVDRSIVVAYAVRAGLRVARLTESAGALVSHEVVREGLPIDSRVAAAAIGIGPDRKIYVATGGDAGSRDPYAGKVLRMNADGSTPSDGWPAPVFAEGLARPVALSWSSDDRTLWVIGVGADGTASASALRVGEHADAGGVVRRYVLPNGAAASGVRAAGALDELVVPADDARSLLSLSSDPSATIVASKWLLRNLFDGIVAVGFGRGDAVWVATRDRLIRVTWPH